LRRAAWFAVSEAQPEDVVVLAGDFNVTTETSAALRDLTASEWGFSASARGIDQILVRGASPTPLRRWPDAERLHEGRLLSDHAPVEVRI
jgi:endonuclease/exonuclease/phosphatase family metal-dependent hydrolase